MRFVAALAVLTVPLAAQYSAPSRPRFEDFPAGEVFQGPNAPVQLLISSERMFKTRLTEASKEPPNFSGHLRFEHWGCGSNCCAGAFLDLKTGRVIQPPLTYGKSGWERWMFKGGNYSASPHVEVRPDSRLFILRAGKAYSEKLDDVAPNTYYYLWEDNRFRLLLRVPADKAAVPTHQK